MNSDKIIFNRTLRLVGADTLRTFAGARVIIFGIGGVGSWTAEALARSGIGHLTLVDADFVALSNINRQLHALHSTVGCPKVEVARKRLLDINPEIDVVTRQERYDAETAQTFDLDCYDVVIDAIDSLVDKALLINNATRSRATLLSSMGAALKMDPDRVRVAEFWQVKGCRLAAALRQKFRRSGEFPARKFKCVYSDELLPNRHDEAPADSSGAMTFGKVAVNGAMMHITALFGLRLAALTLQVLTPKPD
ncbi:MAG: tRNA threonylcarbamoyladenosine dehydratase [Candidatus Amulumruptor caecigallinarius]|nr:tRNA threonylcarbamoyladenosine dehydratase [Candidatus Amulumruptor caecigallinarius]MCM1396702.1 tRNA threonylcarbamoyladenosine dehydratase [Candidatus Amulumruptor caecigallinarius]MCM1453240.1 tRNA threonylcarbamoyladenosine dehydratase [bacterium]